MRVKVRVLGGTEKIVDVEGNRVSDLLRALGYNVDEYVVTRKGKILTEDDEIHANEELTLVPVISGG